MPYPAAQGIEHTHTYANAKDSVEDRVAGLDSGVDDYLVKPFAFAELLARLRALRQFKMDTTTLEVSRQGVVIDLTTKECRLLEYLMRHPHQVLTRTMIAEHVRNHGFDNATNVIDVHIRNPRRKIDEPFPIKLIQTIRGAGYKISDRQSE